MDADGGELLPAPGLAQPSAPALAGSQLERQLGAAPVAEPLVLGDVDLGGRLEDRLGDLPQPVRLLQPRGGRGDRRRRLTAVYRTAAFTGLRMGELIALRWRDVSFDSESLHVYSSYSAGTLIAPKSGLARTVPMAE